MYIFLWNFHLADILLCWIWIVLPWITAEHWCHSGGCGFPLFFWMIKLFEDLTLQLMLFLSLDHQTVLLNMQQVYMYFRGSGKSQELKQQAARGALSSAFWWRKPAARVIARVVSGRRQDVCRLGMVVLCIAAPCGFGSSEAYSYIFLLFC